MAFFLLKRQQFLSRLTRTAKSACEAPPIMLGTKLLWPGASKMVKCFLSVSKYARPTSTVLPLSLSSWLVSRAHDRYLGHTQDAAGQKHLRTQMCSIKSQSLTRFRGSSPWLLSRTSPGFFCPPFLSGTWKGAEQLGHGCPDCTECVT